MRTSEFTEEQIVAALRHVEGGTAVDDICRGRPQASSPWRRYRPHQNRRTAMRIRLSPMLAVVLLSVPSACAAPSRGAAGAGGETAGSDTTAGMSFFLTSAGPGNGANLGGLAGADAHCQALATAAGAGGRTWRAYLSTSAAPGQAAVNARDRIGTGPWYNARGVRVASNVAELHGEGSALGKQGSLTERGDTVNGRGDTPNRHDILTGSQPDGTAFPDTADRTCRNWTSGGDGSAQVGHHDRQGGGERPTSWNSAHPSRGCSQENLRGTGGDGLFYCFAQ
jgi:hypothetical protein